MILLENAEGFLSQRLSEERTGDKTQENKAAHLGQFEGNQWHPCTDANQFMRALINQKDCQIKKGIKTWKKGWSGRQVKRLFRHYFAFYKVMMPICSLYTANPVRDNFEFYCTASMSLFSSWLESYKKIILNKIYFTTFEIYQCIKLLNLHLKCMV